MGELAHRAEGGTQAGAGGWRGQFAAHGTTLHQADWLITATAVNAGARLATGNPKDFPMTELQVERWVVGV